MVRRVNDCGLGWGVVVDCLAQLVTEPPQLYIMLALMQNGRAGTGSAILQIVADHTEAQRLCGFVQIGNIKKFQNGFGIGFA